MSVKVHVRVGALNLEVAMEPSMTVEMLRTVRVAWLCWECVFFGLLGEECLVLVCFPQRALGECGESGEGKALRLFYGGRELQGRMQVSEIREGAVVIGMLVPAPPPVSSEVVSGGAVVQRGSGAVGWRVEGGGERGEEEALLGGLDVERGGEEGVLVGGVEGAERGLVGFDRFRCVGFDDDAVSALRATYREEIVEVSLRLSRGAEAEEDAELRILRAEDEWMRNLPPASEFWLNLRPALLRAVAEARQHPERADALRPALALAASMGIGAEQGRVWAGGEAQRRREVDWSCSPTAAGSFVAGVALGTFMGFWAYICILSGVRSPWARIGILVGMCINLFLTFPYDTMQQQQHQQQAKNTSPTHATPPLLRGG